MTVEKVWRVILRIRLIENWIRTFSFGFLFYDRRSPAKGENKNALCMHVEYYMRYILDRDENNE